MSGHGFRAVAWTIRGREFTVVNIENVSYGLTICAERVAIFAASEKTFASGLQNSTMTWRQAPQGTIGLRFAATPPKVVDANGKFVGWPSTGAFYDHYIGAYTVSGTILKINVVWILVQTDRTGFSNLSNNNSFSFYFASLDCTGAKYLAAYGLPPVGQVIINNTQLLFPGTPVQIFNAGSVQRQSDGTCISTSGGGGPIPVLAGPAQTFKLNNLGLVPPFTVK
jgi:hypothetical protein